MYDVITMGSATVDVFANTDAELIKLVTHEGEEEFITYPSGSKILINELQFLIGGGGTNTAVSFARLGHKTAFLGKLGKDVNAKKVLTLLEAEDIDFLGTQEGQTGYSIILDSIEHDRTILTFKGANNAFVLADVPFDKLRTKWIYSSSLVGASFDTLKAVVAYAAHHGIKVAFNPSNYQAKLGYKALSSVLDNTDAIILNKEEAQLLLGQEANADKLAIGLAKQKDTYVVITDGANGATCYHDGQIIHLSPSPDVTVVETTGAGDAFASGFVAGIIDGLPLLDALKLGMVQAENVISKPGAKETLLHKKEAYKHINTFKGTHTITDVSKAEQLHIEEPSQHLPGFHIAPQGQEFHLHNGKSLTSIEELAYYLKFMDEKEFREHVDVDKNHFADWIAGVFENHELAKLIRDKSSKKDISDTLLGTLHKDIHKKQQKRG